MNTQKVIRRFYLYQFISGLHLIGAVLIPFFTDWGGITKFEAQALQSWFTFWIFMLEVPTGVIADTVGRKHSIALGSLVMGIGALLYGSVPDLAVFAIGEFLFAAGVALRSGADSALIYDALLAGGREKEAKAVQAHARSLHLAAIFVGALLGSMIQKFGLNLPMLLTSVTSLIAAVAAYSIPEPPRISDAKEQRNFMATLRKGFVPLKENPTLRRWAVNSMLVSAAGYFVIWLYQPLMQKVGLPVGLYGPAQAFLVVAEVAVAATFVRSVRFAGSLGTYAGISALLVSIGYLSAAIHPKISTLFVFLVFSGGIGLTRDQMIVSEMNKFIKSEERATTLSAISMMTRILQAVLNPVVGYLADISVLYSLFLVSVLPILAFFAPIKRNDTDD